MFNLREYKNHNDKLQHYLTWAVIADSAPGVMINKDGSLQQTIGYRGPDLFSATDSEVLATAASINNAFKRLGTRWTLFSEMQKRKNKEFYETDSWPNAAAELVDMERRNQFKHIVSGYSNTYYLTFVYLPPVDIQKKILDKFFSHPTNSDYNETIKAFKSEVNSICSVLSKIFPYIKKLDNDETLTYLHSCVSTKYHPVSCPLKPNYLDYFIADQPFLTGIEPKLGDSYIKVVSIRSYEIQRMGPNALTALNDLDFEFRWVSRFICLDRDEAVKELKKYSDRWFAKRMSGWDFVKSMIIKEEQPKINATAVEYSNQCDDMKDIIQKGMVSGGFFTPAIVVWDKDKERLEKKVEDIEGVINNGMGFTSVAETFNCTQAWFGSLPGQIYSNVRKPMINSLNFTHMVPVTANWDGPEKNEHLNAPPLFQAMTKEKTPFRFSNHVGDVGHAMIIGPTGAGKSVLLKMMAMSAQRYRGCQIYFFDKKYAAYCATILSGGKHYDLGKKESFQPLRDIDDDKTRRWAHEWLMDILQHDGILITPDIKKELWVALTNLSSSSKQHRTLTGLKGIIQNKDVAAALETYRIDSAAGNLLDADDDDFSDSKFQTFEMGYLLEYMKSMVVPVLTYLFYKIESSLTGQPTYIFLDESWIVLDSPLFEDRLKVWLKTVRSKNCSVIFGTQSLSEIAESKIVHTLIGSCPTRIYLPDNSAEKTLKLNEIYSNFGLNERQIKIIAEAEPKKEYYIQSSAGNRKIDLDLGPVALAIYGSESQADQNEIKRLKESNEDILDKFLQYKGVVVN